MLTTRSMAASIQATSSTHLQEVEAVSRWCMDIDVLTTLAFSYVQMEDELWAEQQQLVGDEGSHCEPTMWLWLAKNHQLDKDIFTLNTLPLCWVQWRWVWKCTKWRKEWVRHLEKERFLCPLCNRNAGDDQRFDLKLCFIIFVLLYLILAHQHANSC